MTKGKPIVTWTCDRCGQTEDGDAERGPDRPDFPAGWIELHQQRGGFPGGVARVVHLCPACSEAFAAFLAKRREPSDDD